MISQASGQDTATFIFSLAFIFAGLVVGICFSYAAMSFSENLQASINKLKSNYVDNKSSDFNPWWIGGCNSVDMRGVLKLRTKDSD